MIITHRCVKCGHPDVWGQPGTHPVLGTTRPTGCGQACTCRAGKCQWGEPSTLARFDNAGQPITDVVEPGADLPFYTARKACACAGCKALYTQLTAQPTGRNPTS